MLIKFSRGFDFAEDGIRQRHFGAGETHDVSQSCADSAIQVGAGAPPGMDQPAQPKAPGDEEIASSPSPKGKRGRPPRA